MKKTIAIFDLDKTLIPFDCDQAWGHFLYARGWVEHDFLSQQTEIFPLLRRHIGHSRMPNVFYRGLSQSWPGFGCRIFAKAATTSKTAWLLVSCTCCLNLGKSLSKAWIALGSSLTALMTIPSFFSSTQVVL